KSDCRIVVGRADSHLQGAEGLSSGSGAPLALAQSKEAGVNDGSVCVLEECAIGDVNVLYGQSAAFECVIESTRGDTLQREFVSNLIGAAGLTKAAKVAGVHHEIPRGKKAAAQGVTNNLRPE